MMSSLAGFGVEVMFFGMLSGTLYSCISCVLSCSHNCITSPIMANKWSYFLLSNNGLAIHRFLPLENTILYLLSPTECS